MTLEDVKRAMPRIPPARFLIYGEPLVEAMQAAAVDTPLRAAHFLAQVGHESLDLRYVEELASGADYDGRVDLGNVYPGDGPRFKGRGLIQLTGRANYSAYGRDIDRDLISDPGAVAEEPALAVGVATWFWIRHNLNALADQNDLARITRRINGGLRGIEDRAERLLTAKKALGA